MQDARGKRQEEKCLILCKNANVIRVKNMTNNKNAVEKGCNKRDITNHLPKESEKRTF